MCGTNPSQEYQDEQGCVLYILKKLESNKNWATLQWRLYWMATKAMLRNAHQCPLHWVHPTRLMCRSLSQKARMFQMMSAVSWVGWIKLHGDCSRALKKKMTTKKKLRAISDNCANCKHQSPHFSPVHIKPEFFNYTSCETTFQNADMLMADSAGACRLSRHLGAAIQNTKLLRRHPCACSSQAA